MNSANVRRVISFVIALLILASLVSCTDNKPGDTTSSNQQSTTEAPGTVLETTADTTIGSPTTEAPETEPAATTAPVTEPSTTAAPETEPPTTAAPETEPPTTAAPVTEPPTTAAPETEPVTTVPVTTEKPKPRTAMPTGVISTDAYIFANVEEYATVKLYKDGKLVLTSSAQGPCFMTSVPEAGYYTVKATAEGKSESAGYTVRVNNGAADPAGGACWAGLNSRLFYNGTYGFYNGSASVSNNELQGTKIQLENHISQIRARTGKNTKLIIIVVSNPAAIYHSEQYAAPWGPGDILASTPTTQFVDFMKGNEDIYVLDTRSVLLQHKDELIFHQTDTHYTELGAFYCYQEMMKYVKKDYPNALVHPLSDYKIDYVTGGKGDLTSIMGLNAFYEYTPYLNPKFSSDLVGSMWEPKRQHSAVGINVGAYPTYSEINAPNNPTAYIIGDSYSANFVLFASQAFSKLYANQNVMSNSYIDLSKNPDYIVEVWTERNIGLGTLINIQY